jgi:hypothetical protein
MKLWHCAGGGRGVVLGALAGFVGLVEADGGCLEGLSTNSWRRWALDNYFMEAGSRLRVVSLCIVKLPRGPHWRSYAGSRYFVV